MLDGRAREWLDAGSFFEWVPSEPLRQVKKLSIFHAEFGDPDAPILALLHGFPTSSIDWCDVVGALSEEHRVCVLDFPGFGFSDKPAGESYTLRRDCELVDHYLQEVLGARTGMVVAHDRGDSVALAFAARCASGESAFELSHLVLSNGNLFLPLSNLNPFQRLVLDSGSAPDVVAAATPDALATGLGENTFTPPRSLQDPAIAALAQTFEFNDGLAVIHDTIQYLAERSEREEEWLEALAQSDVPTAVIWGLYDVVSPLRVAAHVWNAYLATEPGANELWLLPRANHYLQHDQPREFAEVVSRALSRSSPDAPGPLSSEPDAPILVDRSRAKLPSAKDVLAGP
jgi:pimeloyl-ACP methyl ester carboxylesterase